MTSVLFCGCNKLVEVEDEIVELSTWFFTSGVANNLITVEHSDANAIFEITVDKGCFLHIGTQGYVQTLTVNNGDTVRWQEFTPEGVYEKFEIAYVEIIAKVDDKIVGYAVIKISPENGLSFNAEIVKSAIFPKVDGQYQKVTQKQVEAKINAVKK